MASKKVKKASKPQNWGELIELDDNIVYNPTGDIYIAFLKKLNKHVLVKGEIHRAIIESYSDLLGEPATISELSRAHGIPRDILTDYIKLIGAVHSDLPYSKEQLEKMGVQELAEDLLERKKFKVVQQFLKRDWQQTQNFAKKWMEFEIGILKPFENALSTWKPQVSTQVAVPACPKSGKSLVIALSDLHFGSAANPLYMYNSKGGWDTKKTVKVVKNYCSSILAAAKQRNYKFDRVDVLFLGDFLHSCSGETMRGTKLKYDCIREEQFDYALASLVEFFNQIVPKFSKIEVHTCGGNHAYEAEIGLYRAVEMMFKPHKHVKFNHYASRPAPFLVNSTLFLMDHGQDSGEKVHVPGAEGKLKQHVNSLLVQKPELLNRAKSIIFCQGDKHHWKHIELDNFEFIMFSTSVGSDEHAAVNNWNNRARQSCLVLDDKGLSEILHFYTDELIK